MVELSEEIISRIISRCKRIGESVEQYHQRHKLTDCLTFKKKIKLCQQREFTTE